VTWGSCSWLHVAPRSCGQLDITSLKARTTHSTISMYIEAWLSSKIYTLYHFLTHHIKLPCCVYVMTSDCCSEENLELTSAKDEMCGNLE
jgi:hypothetical protein